MCEFFENATKLNADDYELVPDRMNAEDRRIFQIGASSWHYNYWDVKNIDIYNMCGRKLV